MTQNGYDFYLDGCLLPVTPQKLEMKINNVNKTITLINGGEVNILKTAGLTDVELECMLPLVECHIEEYEDYYYDEASSKKEAKRLAAYHMLLSILNHENGRTD